MQSSTTQKWTGRWEQLTGRVKEFWGDVTDNDLKRVEGKYDQLVGLIHERTGETREEIERRLND